MGINIRETVVSLVGPVSLKATLECGQAFRWRPVRFPGRPELPVAYRGVIGLLAIVVGQADRVSNEIFVAWEEPPGFSPGSWASGSTGESPPSGASEPEKSGNAPQAPGPSASYVAGLVRRYFSDQDDIRMIEDTLSRSDGVMAEAVGFGRGLRILTQDPWECLASYVLSSTRSIPSISKTIEHLATCFGDSLGMGAFSFPSPEVIACQEVSSLRQSKCGFRDKYLHDAAQKVASGDVDLSSLGSMPVAEARKELMRIRGVGPKVADCVLLFGYHRLEVFPVDVWIARAVSEYFMGGKAVSPRKAREFGERRFGPLAGYAQEYLFYWIRRAAPRQP
jgi:N-glycosylase/DNA lyase